MYCVHLEICLFWFASIVCSLPQLQTAASSNVENIIPSEISDLIGTNENEFSRNTDRMLADIPIDRCLDFDLHPQNSLNRRDTFLNKKTDSGAMCTAEIIFSSIEHEGEHYVYDVSPLDGRQANTNARGEKDFKICPEEIFLGRPIPVCPSPLGGELLTMPDGTLSIQYATSTCLILNGLIFFLNI